MDTNKVLGIVGSPRGKCDEQRFKDIILQIKDEDVLNMVIEKMARDRSMSNTEICLMASLFSVKDFGLDFEIINLKKYFKGESLLNANKLENLVNSAKGIIIASPVYFGDMSSLISSFMNFLRHKSLLKDKIVGCVSAGAKRNGGQETTNIFTLKEANDHGAYVVGNGPPTSQYGGTAWAGDIGTIREDEVGISTSIGTGRKVVEVISLLNKTDATMDETLRVSIWIVKDSQKRIIDELNKIMNFATRNFKFNIEWDVIDFTPMNFHACLACNRCPWHHDKNSLYKCKIKEDDFVSIYDRLVNTDAILVCGNTPTAPQNVNDVYHKVLERTRTIRRDDFLLSNVPVSSLSFEESPSNSLFSLKVMTSFLRHNTVVGPPLNVFSINREWTTDNIKNVLQSFLSFSMEVKMGRCASLQNEVPLYLPIGYSP